MTVVGSVDLTLNINGYNLIQRFLIIRGLHHRCILGNDFFEQTQAIIDYRRHILSLFDNLIVTSL
jgi:hypothetical protein